MSNINKIYNKIEKNKVNLDLFGKKNKISLIIHLIKKEYQTNRIMKNIRNFKIIKLIKNQN